MANVWVANSEVVLSAALWWGHEGMERVWFGKGIEGRHFAPQHVPIYDAAMALYSAGQPVTPETILAQLKGKADIEQLRSIREKFDGWEASEASAGIIRKEALKAADIAAMKRAITQYEKGAERDAVVSELSQVLSQDDNVQSYSHKLGDAHKRVMDGEVTFSDPIPTGLPWFDEILDGGVRAGEVIAIAGPEKGRKTSCARNLALGAARNSPDVAIAMFNYENNVFITSEDFVAMLAFEYLWKSDQHETKTKSGKLVGDIINGNFMMTLGPKYKQGHVQGILGDAYGYATAQIDAVPIYGWDVTEDYGGLDTLEDLRRAFVKFKAMEPERKRIAIIDYAQLVRAGGDTEDDLYKNMRAFSRAIPIFAQKYQCAAIVLSQQSEEYKKTGDHTKTTGAKGGGDLGAAITSFFETSVSADFPDELTITRTRARRGAQAGKDKKHGQQTSYKIHAPSGYFMWQIKSVTNGLYENR